MTMCLLHYAEMSVNYGLTNGCGEMFPLATLDDMLPENAQQSIVIYYNRGFIEPLFIKQETTAPDQYYNNVTRNI